uniref:Restriction endonuclease n=1 Tax=Candidatus Kentrum sp. MB TaxID=2138164 RepID=A0A450Y2Z3_9GAMM|nr:MAG: Putative restriction endonuclease [Candidatus Kentron sp. MB]VFK35884.1 MAG: Putative restriction endonuclease [Candidatus Kentron sp. MB]VFK77533.1 MAG: Putative restriction endonuclease [Candidatus Kentron sp. MB]
MSLARIRYLSPEAYLNGESVSKVRHEYIEGDVFAMAGASERHNRIAVNIAFALRSAARGGPCGVFVSDMKVRVGRERFYYPDVMLVCEGEDDDAYYKDRPCLIAEVVSDSSEGTDRREKWFAYRAIPSLGYSSWWIPESPGLPASDTERQGGRFVPWDARNH